MENEGDFQKKAFELWMAVTMFMSTYQKESGSAVVKAVASMLPFASDLQNFWVAYQNASSNQLVGKLHTKMRARVKLMQDGLEESIRACGTDQRMLDKYSENQNYIERKLNELKSLMPKEPRHVDEPEQVLLDFGSSVQPQSQVEAPVEEKPVDERFMKRLNELKVSVSGFLSSYDDKGSSVVGYVSDMDGTLKVLERLWMRHEREQGNVAVMDSMRKCVATMKSQFRMSELLGGGSSANHEYVLKKLQALERALPN